MSDKEAEIRFLLSAADYVEKLLSVEQQWIMNRMSWLLISQSFLVAAYVRLVTTPTVAERAHVVLGISIPVLGIICSVLVFFAIGAAQKVTEGLLKQRKLLTSRINEELSLEIPDIGNNDKERTAGRSKWVGGLPSFLLPLLLPFFWLLMLILLR